MKGMEMFEMGYLPTHLVGQRSERVFDRPIKPAPAMMSATKALRVSGLKVGAIVRQIAEGEDGPCYVVAQFVNVWKLEVMDLATGRASQPYASGFALKGAERALLWKVVYAPILDFTVPILSVSRLPDEGMTAYQTRVRPLLTEIGARLGSSDRYVNQHGEFWRRSVADRLAAELALD